MTVAATIDWQGKAWSLDLANPTDIAIPIHFGGPQPNAFHLPMAQAAPFEAPGFVGDVSLGGPVNCYDVQLNPHGNGTHTECVGHIVATPVSVEDILQDTLMLVRVITVPTVAFAASDESYDAPNEGDDRVVTREWEGGGLDSFGAIPDALIVRTLPNDTDKLKREYSGNRPPYFTTDAMTWIRQQGVKHLLVDFPSVDREEDSGRLCNHRVFWDVAAGATEFENVPSPHTITEMVYVPNTIEDGVYGLTIQIPAFVLDAAPSRPRLFPAT